MTFGPRRALAIYLAAIVAPTVGLLWISFSSFRKQRDELIRLSTQRRSEEVARLTQAAAAECLRDPDATNLVQSLAGPDSPRKTGRRRLLVNEIRRRHPVALYLLLMKQGRLRFPLVLAPPESAVEDPAFAAAEALEIQRRDFAGAIALYREILAGPLTPESRALALWRVARCLRQSQRLSEAQTAYSMLGARFRNVYDPFHRPYALVAAFESDDREALQHVFRQFIQGEWELAADQAEHFLARFQEAGLNPGDLDDKYIGELRYAAAFERAFQHHGPVQPGKLYPFTFSGGQTYFTLTAPDTLMTVAVDPTWIRVQVAPVETASFRELWIQGAVTFLIAASFATGVYVLSRDLFRERRLRQLRADFVSGVSHDMNTPVSTIRLNAERLIDSKSVSEEEGKESCEAILRQANRLTRLIDNVLSFDKMGRGADAYVRRPADLAEVVKASVSGHLEHLKRRGFDVRAHFEATLPPISMDAEAIGRAVWNLLDNAVKYSDDHKYIRLEIKSRPGAVVFEIEDRGTGIPAGEIERVFERFHRGHNVCGKGGYGIGLFLVRRIMEAHGGRAEVKSTPRQGSCFRLIFPV